MKLIKLLFIIPLINSLSLKTNVLPITPKANDLDNHYGTDKKDDIFGVHHTSDIAREGITGLSVGIKPITNLAEIKENEVASGDLSNTAYDATKIITPETAEAKLKIHSDIVHEAVIQTPVQLGNYAEKKNVEVLDRATGSIDSTVVTTQTPIVEVVNNLREVTTPHDTLVNIETRKIIDTTPKFGYNGIDK